MSGLARFGVIVVEIALGATVLLALLGTVISVRRWRTGPYFLIREAAASSVRRWGLILIVSALALGGLLSMGRPANIAARIALPAPSPTLAPANTPPTDTVPPPTVTAESANAPTEPTSAATITSAPGSAPTHVPSATPSPPIATRDSTVTPQGDARLTITAVSSGINADFSPTDPGDTFTAGIPSFYIFFDFDNMNEGVSWSGVVLVNGEVYEEASFDQIWTMGASGVNWWRSFEWTGGWPAGQYEVRFYIGDQLADSISFRLTNSSG